MQHHKSARAPQEDQYPVPTVGCHRLASSGLFDWLYHATTQELYDILNRFSSNI